MAGLSIANLQPWNYSSTSSTGPKQTDQGYQSQQTYYQPQYVQGRQTYRNYQPAPAQGGVSSQSPWDEKIIGSINDRLGQILGQDPNRISRTDSDVMPMAQQIDAMAQRNARMARQQAAERAGAEGTLQSGNFSAEVGQINDLYHQRQATQEAQLMQDQLGQRRAQIMQALQLGSGLIDNATERGLRAELANMQNQQFYSDLGLRSDLGFGQLDLGWAQNQLNRELGFGDLGLRGRQLDQQNSQFYDRLGFDQAAYEQQVNQNLAMVLGMGYGS